MVDPSKLIFKQFFKIYFRNTDVFLELDVFFSVQTLKISLDKEHIFYPQKQTVMLISLKINVLHS